jgi:hypothetical protein
MLRGGGYVTLNTSTTKETGTAPPDLMVTGTPNGLYDFRFEVTTGGPRGTMMFRWSSNGGANWTSGVLSAATNALGSTGMTANWSTGTDYSTDNTYRTAVRTFSDSSLRGLHFTQPPASNASILPAVELTGLNGRPSLLFDGVDDFLELTDSTALNTIFGGNDTSVSVTCVAQIVGATADKHMIWSATDDVASTTYYTFYCEGSTWRVVRRGTSGGEVVTIGGANNAAANIHQTILNGTTLTHYVNNVLVLGPTTVDVPSLSVSKFQIGATRSIANIYGNVRIGAVEIHAGANSAAVRGFQYYRLKHRWGL